MPIFETWGGERVILVIDGSKLDGALIERGFQPLPQRVI
jgi:hypothetical protein